MRIVHDAEIRIDLSRLSAAWSAVETFALLPEKVAVSAEWIENAGKQLPAAQQTGHFALLTSGTTGEPKLVITPRQRTERLSQVLHDLQDSEPIEETILALPLTYSYAFVNQWVWARVHGRRLTPTPGLGQPQGLADALRQARAAMICLVGVQVPLLAQFFAGQAFPGVLRVHFAGGRFPQEKLSVVRGFFPNARIFNNYGCAEAMPRLTLRPAEESEDPSDVGRPLPGIEMGKDPSDALIFRSPYGAVGIVGDGGFVPIVPEMWVPTGDLGRPTARGTWRLTGRAGDVFKRHGEKISLSLLVATVCGAWQGQVAFYREQDTAGEDGHVLVLSPVPDERQLRAILQQFRARHPRAWWPLRIESLPQMPVLSNGKIAVRDLIGADGKQVHWQQRI